MKPKCIILRADGTSEERDFPSVYDRQSAARSQLKEIVNGDPETVWVLHKGKRTCMIVNDEGACMDPPLPVNKEATKIYWRASTRRNMDCDEKTYAMAFNKLFDQVDDPRIHGDVALLENVTVN